jgi:WD40 repeat protein
MPSILPAFNYQIGGSLGVKAPCYVVREADQELYAGLKSGMFCYVLNSRQMGKSSLRVQTMHRLHQDGIVCGVVDITAIGSQEITPEQWYASILSCLVSSFRLNINLRDWWRENLYLSPIKRLNKFVEEVLLVETSQNIVIFIDEIDSILGLPFSVDDFFAWIRSCYNKRTDQPAYQRLTFALLGVATPSNLITDKNRTPFNIGRAISLNGFELAEIQPLAQGLVDRFEHPQDILAEVLAWTGGQPFLTQKVCRILWEDSSNLQNSNADRVKTLVHQRIINNWGTQDEPEHLKTIRDRLLRNGQQLNRLLGFYGQILDQGEIPFNEDSEQMELLLSGLVVRQQTTHNPLPVLKIANPIYAAIFNQSWLEQELAKLRPYAEGIRGWLAADGVDESRLLRGAALQEALAWATDKKLSDDDYRFLNASQALETQTIQALNEQRLSKILKVFLVAALIVVFLLAGLTGLSIRIARQATISEITALNSFSTNFYTSNSQPFDALIPALRAGRRINTLLLAPTDLKSTIQNNLQKDLLAVKERNRFAGHSAPVMGANFSPDGQMIASASWDNTIKLWNTAGQNLKTFRGHTAELWNVVFSPDGQMLASASSDQTVKLWSINGELLHTLSGHTGVVGEVAFSPDGQLLASAGSDGVIKLWTTEGEELRTLAGHQGWTWGLSFSPDGQTIVSGGADRLIKRWNLAGQELQTIKGHQDTVTEVIFSADGQRLASTSNDGTVKIWSIDGHELQTFAVSGAQLWDLHWSPDGQTLAAVSSDATVRLWDLDGQNTKILKTVAQVARLNFSPNGEYLLLASWDNSVKLWRIADRLAGSQIITAHAAQLTDVSFSHQGQQIATTSWDRTIKLWNRQGKELKVLQQGADTKNYAPWSVSFSPNDQILATVIWDGRIILWNTLGQEIRVIPGVGRLKTSFSPDGKSIIAGSKDNSFQLWSVEGQKMQTFVGHDRPVTAVHFSGDGQYLVSASADQTVRLWTVKGQLLKTFLGHQGEVNTASFSPDDRLIVSGGVDGTARLWQLNGLELKRLMNHSGAVTDVKFSPDGQILATASVDKTVHLWNLAGQKIKNIDQHSAAVTSIFFSADGQTLASGGFDNKLILTSLTDAAKADLQSSLREACDWLSDYLDTNAAAAIDDRNFCRKLMGSQIRQS